MNLSEISPQLSTKSTGCPVHDEWTCEECTRDMNEALDELSGDFYVTPLGSLQILCFGSWDKCFEFQVNYEGDSAMYSEADFTLKWEAQPFVLTLGGPTAIAEGSLNEMETLLVETILGYAEWFDEEKNISAEITKASFAGDTCVMSKEAFNSL